MTQFGLEVARNTSDRLRVISRQNQHGVVETSNIVVQTDLPGARLFLLDDVDLWDGGQGMGYDAVGQPNNVG